MESGILYVVFNNWIRNPVTNELSYKIGITRNSVYDRYYGLGLKMPGKFETLFAYKFEDCAKAEQIIHGILNKYRENGEWFNIGQRELDHIKSTCELMHGILITDEIKNEIDMETGENLLENQIKSKDDVYQKTETTVSEQNIYIDKAINPKNQCRIFLFPIHDTIKEGKTVYDATRSAWTITEEYRNISKYEFAVGLQNFISLGSYKIENWKSIYNTKNKYEFEGKEIPDFKGFSWQKLIYQSIGYWQRGNHFVVEFDGNGKFKLLRPNKNQWIDCL